MAVLTRPWGAMHYDDQGPKDGEAVVFANSLGTDFRMWQAVLPLLPEGLRLIRFDKRGHGLSDLGGAPSIADLAQDAESLITTLGLGPVIFVGLSVGGLIGQSLAARRPDLLRALVLSNTAARIGTPQLWQDRVDMITKDGLAGIADGMMQRWFGPRFRESPEVAPWRNMLARSDVAGYLAICRAIGAADLTATTSQISHPTLVIAGSEDGATPPDLVHATAQMISGAQFALIEGAGHLPPVEAPTPFAAHLCTFLKGLPHD